MLLNIFRKNLYELYNRLFFIICYILVFRIGSFIPIPCLNMFYIYNLDVVYEYNLLSFLNIFFSGFWFYYSIFSLGIMPYISASIIIQVLTIIYPFFIRLRKSGISGHYKISEYTRYTTLLLSLLQSPIITFSLFKFNILKKVFFFSNKINFYFISTICIVTGTIFLMWLSEQISERGIGNGISIFIFINIIYNLPNIIIRSFNKFYFNILNILKLIFLIFMILCIVLFIVFIEQSERKILVYYASSRIFRNKYSLLSLKDTYLPLRLNVTGIFPAIFSSSFVVFVYIFFWCINFFFSKRILNEMIYFFYPKSYYYFIYYLLLVIFFCFFYSILVFDSKEISNNLMKSGAYIPGIRPGYNTYYYIYKIIIRLSLFISFYISFVCFFNDFINEVVGIYFYIGGTSLLIVVVVIIEFIYQVKALIISNQYLSILKKSKIL